MDAYTGHLVRDINLIDEDRRKNYTPVPNQLNRAASQALAGKDETHISLTSGGKLSKFAASKRKAKRKQAAKSRKKNR